MAGGEVHVRVPAKVNLQLRVGPRRPDGFHEVATAFHAVSLFDDLTATVAEPGTGIVLAVQGPQADLLPLDHRNLAVRAAELLAGSIGVEPDVRLWLRKGIPVAGGMAGGSADAAAALVACDALWDAGLTRQQLHELATDLGSDVPFALLGGTAVGTGRGERLTPAMARGEYHWVIATADHGLSTSAVYAEIDRLRDAGEAPAAPSDPEVSGGLMQALRAGNPTALGAALANDLGPAACSLDPGLARTLDAGRAAGALGAQVCGSGPSTVFLARDNSHSVDLAAELAGSGTAAEVRRAIGPVPGARLVEPVRG